MPSPSPGMDPYLQAHSRDVHTRLIVYIIDEIHSQLTGPLRARVEERLTIEAADGTQREVAPDARVFESRPGRRVGTPLAGGSTATIDPPVIPAPPEVIRERYVQIIGRSGPLSRYAGRGLG